MPAAGNQRNAYHYQAVKAISVPHGAVVSAHPLASQAGLHILREGGNAIDAAIATQFALAVVYPLAGNIGGGGFMVIHTQTGKNTTIDYRETAPGQASRDMYLDSAGNADPEKSRNGALAVGVPGTVAGLFLAHERYGKLPMATLLQPAIDLAAKGYVLTARSAAALNHAQPAFKKYNSRTPVFVKPGDWQAGDTLVQKDLAGTLQRIQQKGAAGFYGGKTARLIVEEMQRSGGIISLADLKQYRAVERTARQFDYKGYQIVSMPLPSSGGILLQQMLGMLSAYPVGDYGFESAKAVQLMVEIERRAYADRALYLGDPDFNQVPVAQLTAAAYLKSRMADFRFGQAGSSDAIAAGQFPEHEETTHLSVMDSAGNAVAVTYTLNNVYGSKVVVGGAGFVLNDEMDDFSAKPGAPNMFGLLGAEANAIAPGKRMLSSMTPTLVLQEGQPVMVLGSPGGATIITSVFQTLVDVIDFHLPLEQAVNAPKFHHQWKPDLIYIEKGFPDSVQTTLEQMGYHFRTRSPIGRTDVILKKGDTLHAVADGRGDDSAAGY